MSHFVCKHSVFLLIYVHTIFSNKVELGQVASILISIKVNIETHIKIDMVRRAVNYSP